jgi:hypothetical protein
MAAKVLGHYKPVSGCMLVENKLALLPPANRKDAVVVFSDQFPVERLLKFGSEDAVVMARFVALLTSTIAAKQKEVLDLVKSNRLLLG